MLSKHRDNSAPFTYLVEKFGSESASSLFAIFIAMLYLAGQHGGHSSRFSHEILFMTFSSAEAVQFKFNSVQFSSKALCSSDMGQLH